MIHRSHFSEQTAAHCLCMYMQPDKIFASKRLGTSYIPVSLVSGATVCTCGVEVPLGHFYMHYDGDLSI